MEESFEELEEDDKQEVIMMDEEDFKQFERDFENFVNLYENRQIS